MYIIGIIKTDIPKVLISPKIFHTSEELFDWLSSFFNKEDFKLSEPISLEKLMMSLKQSKPLRVNIAGYPIAVLLGEDGVIQNATERYIHITNLDLLAATAEEVQEYIKFLECEN
jgi:hypothetical protein